MSFFKTVCAHDPEKTVISLNKRAENTQNMKIGFDISLADLKKYLSEKALV